LNCFWKIPSADLSLSEKEIHIWCAALDLPIINFEKLNEALCREERLKAERFHFERERRRFIVGRGILRRILSHYLSIRPVDLQFSYGENGKPGLTNSFRNGRIDFNMTRSEGLALYGFARDRQIGVDVERIRDLPEMDRIVEIFFSERENDIFRSLPENRKKEAFFRCWTRKEAFIKATGNGLSQSLDRFDVSISPDEPARLLGIEGSSKGTTRWSIQDLKPAPGFAAAFAVEGRNWQLHCWQWLD